MYIYINLTMKKLKKKYLHTVRFELTRVASPDLESGALDRSAICALDGIEGGQQSQVEGGFLYFLDL